MLSRLLQHIGWPSQCLICRSWPSSSLCAHCVTRFTAPAPRCVSCALPVPAGVAQCGACLRQPPPIDRCLAATSYGWPWTRCIAQFKFYNHPGLAAPLAKLMAVAPGVADTIARADVVVPLPLSPERLAERGYNPAQLLAHHLSSQRLQIDVLQRIRHAPPQHHLPRAERLKNVRGAFAVPPARHHAVCERHVVLVDDVMTTGASLYDAARALRQAGARYITALVLARTDAP